MNCRMKKSRPMKQTEFLPQYKIPSISVQIKKLPGHPLHILNRRSLDLKGMGCGVFCLFKLVIQNNDTPIHAKPQPTAKKPRPSIPLVPLSKKRSFCTSDTSSITAALPGKKRSLTQVLYFFYNFFSIPILTPNIHS